MCAEIKRFFTHANSRHRSRPRSAQRSARRQARETGSEKKKKCADAATRFGGTRAAALHADDKTHSPVCARDQAMRSAGAFCRSSRSAARRRARARATCSDLCGAAWPAISNTPRRTHTLTHTLTHTQFLTHTTPASPVCARVRGLGVSESTRQRQLAALCCASACALLCASAAEICAYIYPCVLVIVCVRRFFLGATRWRIAYRRSR